MYNNVYVYHIHLIYLHKDTTMHDIELNYDARGEWVTELLNMNDGEIATLRDCIIEAHDDRWVIKHNTYTTVVIIVTDSHECVTMLKIMIGEV